MTTPTNREIWDIAWPVLLSLLAQHIVGVTDTAFLGRVGEVELGASAIGGVFYLILFMVGFGFTIGVQILVARRYGEKNYDSIGAIFDNSFYFIGLFSLLVTVVVFFFGGAFLRLFLTSDAICQASSVFLKYRVLGLFFASCAMLFRSFYTGISFTKYLSISAAIMAVLNIFLDYLLIFGHGGFPKLGIQGLPFHRPSPKQLLCFSLSGLPGGTAGSGNINFLLWSDRIWPSSKRRSIPPSL